MNGLVIVGFQSAKEIRIWIAAKGDKLIYGKKRRCDPFCQDHCHDPCKLELGIRGKLSPLEHDLPRDGL